MFNLFKKPKFNIGDEVLLRHYIVYSPIYRICEVRKLVGEFYYSAVSIERINGKFDEQFERPEINFILYKQNNILFKTKMEKITTLLKSVIDKDYRRMIKVGWLDNDLSLTEEGKDAVLANYLSTNKIKFGKLAQDILDEIKEEKDCKD